jgi:hypothetical protein
MTTDDFIWVRQIFFFAVADTVPRGSTWTKHKSEHLEISQNKNVKMPEIQRKP